MKRVEFLPFRLWAVRSETKLNNSVVFTSAGESMGDGHVETNATSLIK